MAASKLIYIFLALIACGYQVQAETRPTAKFFVVDNGVTVSCRDVAMNETGVVNGVHYTKRTKELITNDNAQTTCTGGIMDMSSLFSFSPFNGNISTRDTSQVTTMGNIFLYAQKFNQPIGSWDTSSVIDMWDMCNSAVDFNHDISNWDTSKVTSM